ncbi:MFS transporter [Streptomyces sp. NA04227]|nr:MFS transporter [Streptomyces sp. NA04227]
MVPSRNTAGPNTPGLSPWRFVVAFGVVSLLADFVYEGARSVTGPLLASFGASAMVVGAVTGAGEAAALLLRLGSGPLADRTGRFWSWTIGGYALTVASVPLLGVSGVLWVACALVIAERVGKAVRSPAKDTLLSHATAATGRGRGFAVHEAMDQIGALLGPLTVAGMLALTGDDYAPTLAVLALPGLFVLLVLLWLRARVPNPQTYEVPQAYEESAAPKGRAKSRAAVAEPAQLPRAFWVYACFTAVTLTGFATFGVLSFHLVESDLVGAAAVPLVYVVAMAADAVAALATGWAYDRTGPRVLVVLPVLSGLTALLAFGDTLWAVLAGAVMWGAATGVQESTLRATVADLVPVGRRATAYGLFAAVVGGAAFLGGLLTGALYERSVPVLVTVVLLIQAFALVLLLASRGLLARERARERERVREG